MARYLFLIPLRWESPDGTVVRTITRRVALWDNCPPEAFARALRREWNARPEYHVPGYSLGPVRGPNQP